MRRCRLHQKPVLAELSRRPDVQINSDRTILDHFITVFIYFSHVCHLQQENDNLAVSYRSKTRKVKIKKRYDIKYRPHAGNTYREQSATSVCWCHSPASKDIGRQQSRAELTPVLVWLASVETLKCFLARVCSRQRC